MKTLPPIPAIDRPSPILLRVTRPLWLAVEELRKQFTSRDLVPYSLHEVIVFLIESYLHEHQHLSSPAILRGRGARQLNRRKLEQENAALRQQLAEILNQKSEENQ